MDSMRHFINQQVLKKATLSYRVSERAPNTHADLLNESSLVIWSGASQDTWYQDARVNWAFRAFHDALHLRTGLGFSHAHELELARIQANQFDSRLMQEFVFGEVAGQAMYHAETGLFVADQVAFMDAWLKERY